MFYSISNPKKRNSIFFQTTRFHNRKENGLNLQSRENDDLNYNSSRIIMELRTVFEAVGTEDFSENPNEVPPCIKLLVNYQ
jgi:hypothetical protein